MVSLLCALLVCRRAGERSGFSHLPTLIFLSFRRASFVAAVLVALVYISPAFVARAPLDREHGSRAFPCRPSRSHSVHTPAARNLRKRPVVPASTVGKRRGQGDLRSAPRQNRPWRRPRCRRSWYVRDLGYRDTCKLYRPSKRRGKQAKSSTGGSLRPAPPRGASDGRASRPGVDRRVRPTFDAARSRALAKTKPAEVDGANLDACSVLQRLSGPVLDNALYENFDQSGPSWRPWLMNTTSMSGDARRRH